MVEKHPYDAFYNYWDKHPDTVRLIVILAFGIFIMLVLKSESCKFAKVWALE